MPNSAISYIDPLYWLGSPTVSEPYNGSLQTTQRPDNVTPTNGGVFSTFGAVTDTLTNLETIFKFVVVGGMLFGGLVLITKAREAFK